MNDETGWLIETNTPTGQPCYWGGPALWTTDNLKAIRFARKLDGERVAEDLDVEGLAVVEHMWSPVKLGDDPPRVDCAKCSKWTEHPAHCRHCKVNYCGRCTDEWQCPKCGACVSEGVFQA